MTTVFPIGFGISTLLLIIVTISYFRLKKQSETRLREAKKKAEEAARAKDTFLANVSHETRTPMNAIIGLSHILLQSDLNDEQKTNLFKIKRSAEHLLSITNDILDYSKLEAGKLTLENILIESSDFFSSIADIIAPMTVEKNLDLIFDISPKIPEQWMGDPLRISQILLNLLNNAVKFTDSGYIELKVDLKDEEGEKRLLFEVTDTGIGLTDEQVEFLFDAFSQADNSISRKFGGTGLGLTISSELAEMMGSRLEVRSRFKEGTTFSFALPLRDADGKEEKYDRLSRRLLEDKTILIADKSPINAKILAGIFSHFRARPKIAEDRTQFDRLLQWEHYDAVCIDSRLIDSTLDRHFIKEHSEAVVVLQYELLPTATLKSFAPDAIVPKPFTPLNIQSTMVELFGKTIIENPVTKKHIGFDDILVLKGSRILLAEDNEGNVMVIEGLLEGSGIRLVTAPNGQKAVETLFNSAPFDLVLMDINMPVMDGYAATSIIREYPKYDNVPIVAMTANITESDMNKTKSAGMQDFIGKPVDIDQFYTILLKYIKPRARIGDVQPMKPAAETAQTRNPAASGDTLPGVDMQEGLARINGNTQAYDRILKKYAELFSDIIPRLETAYKNSRREEGRQLAHNLKGLSGNIGAKEIYRLAAEIEAAFKGEGGNITALLGVLSEKLVPLLRAIEARSAAEQANAEPVRKEPINPAALSGLIESLLVSAGKKKALEVRQGCKTLQQYELPRELDAHFKALFASAEQYRYDEMVKYLQAILKGIG